MKLLSYVLRGNNPRYWHNIPYLLIANSLIYPDFSARFYIHQSFVQYPFIIFLREAAKQFEEVSIEIANFPLRGGFLLENYRVKPLWENNVDYLFCRDVDYALSTLERKAVDYFLAQDKHIVHGIRACGHHNSVFMAGLCGWNVKKVFDIIKKQIPSFDAYVSYGEKNISLCKGTDAWRYGADQALLAKFIKSTGLEKLILECFLLDASLHSLILPNAKPCPISEYQNLQLSFCNNEAQEFLDFLFESPTKWINLNPFIGRAWTCNSENLKKLISIADNKMSALVEKTFIDNFSGVSYEI